MNRSGASCFSLVAQSCAWFFMHGRPLRISTLLVPAAELRRAAQVEGEREGLPSGWLNDAVKGFLVQAGRFEIYAEFSHLRIFVPHPEYLLAMKCLAMRLGEEFYDRSDVAVLLKVLNLKRMVDAQEVLARYYPLDRYPAKARYVLEELLA
jgi:hypothetical protein